MENTFIHSPAQRQGEEQKQKANGLAGEREQQEQDQTPRPKPAHLPFLLHLLRGRETGLESGEHPQRARLVLKNLGVSQTPQGVHTEE